MGGSTAVACGSEGGTTFGDDGATPATATESPDMVARARLGSEPAAGDGGGGRRPRARAAAPDKAHYYRLSAGSGRRRDCLATSHRLPRFTVRDGASRCVARWVSAQKIAPGLRLDLSSRAKSWHAISRQLDWLAAAVRGERVAVAPCRSQPGHGYHGWVPHCVAEGGRPACRLYALCAAAQFRMVAQQQEENGADWSVGAAEPH